MQELSFEEAGRPTQYPIYVGSQLLGRAGELLKVSDYSKVHVITDEHVARHWLAPVLEALPAGTSHIALPAGEGSKTMKHVEQLWRAMEEAGIDRHSLVVVLGGGVIGDMGGFAASTFMRGVPYAQVPTTLLAQVDSSIGGKTGVDSFGIKNLEGTIAQPVAVVSDTDVLATLPKRQLAAGFAEMLKHGLIRDAEYFRALSLKSPDKFSEGELSPLIMTSCRIKTEIVERDETETGPRKLLNFGHTVGHAVEALSWETSSPLLHGEAVAIGMAVEADLSVEVSSLSSEDSKTIKAALKLAGLPDLCPHLPVNLIFEKMRQDKKDTGGVINFTLLRHIGEAVTDQTADDETIAHVIQRNMETAHA